MFPKRTIVVLYIGSVQERNDRNDTHSRELASELGSLHNGTNNLFLEHYLPDEMLAFAFGSLDFAVFWYANGTQSGRMAHAMAAGTCVVGRRLEGIGETLDLAGLPAAGSLVDLEEKMARLIRNPELRYELEAASLEYANEYSFTRQAAKHLQVENALRVGSPPRDVDCATADVSTILPRLVVGRRLGLEQLGAPGLAFLNVADDVDMYPSPKVYERIPLRDGHAIAPLELRKAIDWIRSKIETHTVVVFCRYGRGRSVSVAIGFLCAMGLSYGKAEKLVRRNRPYAEPLPELRETIATALEGPIPTVGRRSFSETERSASSGV
jgi:hypothetical protein